MTPRDPDVERWADALAARGESASPRDDCPDPDEIWAASRGEADGSRARDLLDHAATCEACAEAWRLAREVGASLPTSATPAVARPFRLGWAAAAVAAVAVAAVLLPPLLRRDDGPPVFRREAGLTIESLVPEANPLARDAIVLRWTPGPEGTLYDLSVANERLEPLYEAKGIGEAAHKVPPSAVAEVPPGGRILWRVEARAPDGSRAASPTYFAQIE